MLSSTKKNLQLEPTFDQNTFVEDENGDVYWCLKHSDKHTRLVLTVLRVHSYNNSGVGEIDAIKYMKSIHVLKQFTGIIKINVD